MTKRRVAIFSIAFLVAFFLYNVKWTHKKHQRDTLVKKIQSEQGDFSEKQIPYDPALIAQINTILSQPFYFIGKGKQVAVFASHDESFVLKCMLHKKLKIGSYTTSFPEESIVRYLRKERALKNKEKYKKILTSMQLAYDALPEETGTVYVHLYKTENIHPEVTLVDDRGNLWKLPGDSFEFVIQKKASLLKPTLIRLMYEGKNEQAKQCVTKIIELLSSCAKKGVLDTDGALIRNGNVGFLDGDALLLDTGKLIYSEEIQTKEHFERDLKRLQPLHNWLEKYYPELASHFIQEKKRVLYEFE